MKLLALNLDTTDLAQPKKYSTVTKPFSVERVGSGHKTNNSVVISCGWSFSKQEGEIGGYTGACWSLH